MKTKVITTRTGAATSARLRGPNGAERTAKAAFIAGCDGARSKVRELMGTGFLRTRIRIARGSPVLGAVTGKIELCPFVSVREGAGHLVRAHNLADDDPPSAIFGAPCGRRPAIFHSLHAKSARPIAAETT